MRPPTRLLWALATSLLAMPVRASDPAGSEPQEPDPRCDALFREAVGQLSAEQYPRMLARAKERALLCPDPLSRFLLGLAKANIVDAQLLSDPAAREQLRRAALEDLRVAVAADDALIGPSWRLTAHEWIVHLQRLSPDGAPEFKADSTGPDDHALESSEDWDSEGWDSEDEPIVPAPPPRPSPKFPVGPVLVGLVGLGSMVAGIPLAVSSAHKRDEVREGAGVLQELAKDPATDPMQLAAWAEQTRALNEEALWQQRWARGLLISGAACMAGAALWYWLLPPKGKWRWAATPTAVQTTVRF
jgi:hypothetical protein